MNTITKLPTQQELDLCTSMYDKFKLKPPELCYDLNERDFSRLFAEVTRPYLRYNTSILKWMYYNGRYWETDASGVNVQRCMKEFSFELLKYATNEIGMANEEFLEYVKELGSASKRKTLIKDATDVFCISNDEFDNNPFLFNCQNGTFNLKTMKLQPFNADDKITKISRVIYNPNKTSQVLDTFMNDIFCDDRSLINYVYEILGYSLSGINNQECFWILLGETTRNGKSTLLNTFSYMLGEHDGYATNCDISTLAKNKKRSGSSPSSDIARLKGARFVVASEPSADFELDEAKVKAFTGNDRITARMLYSNDIEFQPTFKIFIGTNHRPNVSDDSILDSHRLKVIPFNRHFSPDEQKRGLKDHLKHPDIISAFFNQCLQGWMRFKNNGLTEPSAVINATAAYQTTGQILQLYFDSQLVKEVGAVTPLAAFYPLYVAWCGENGFTPMSREKVNAYMRSRGLFKATATISSKTVRNILNGYRLKGSADIKAQVVGITEVKPAAINTIENDIQDSDEPAYPF